MNQVLFLLHGIGEHADAALGRATASWASEVEQSLDAARAAYPAIPRAGLTLVPILYDDVFATYQASWSELAAALRGSPLASLTSALRDAAKPGFLWGSLVDIALYKGLAAVRAGVLTHVAAQIARAVRDHGSDARYSILAHSLGTAVAHDAVQKLASTPIEGSRALMPPAFRFENFFALANVSRLVAVDQPDFYQQTRVRPPGCGLAAEQCAVNHYLSFRHVADPIPSVVRFARSEWPRTHYAEVELRHFRDLNVHAFTHYLASPRVVDRVLFRLFGPACMPKDEMRARLAGFPDHQGVRADEARGAVARASALLDRVSGQVRGDFQVDFRALLEAIPFVLGELRPPQVRG